MAPSLDVIMEHRLVAHWRQIAVSCSKHPASATFMKWHSWLLSWRLPPPEADSIRICQHIDMHIRMHTLMARSTRHTQVVYNNHHNERSPCLCCLIFHWFLFCSLSLSPVRLLYQSRSCGCSCACPCHILRHSLCQQWWKTCLVKITQGVLKRAGTLFQLKPGRNILWDRDCPSFTLHFMTTVLKGVSFLAECHTWPPTPPTTQNGDLL